MSDERDGVCFDCGGPAAFLIFLAGEDEKPQEEFACTEHSRGHWRSAILEPVTMRKPIVLDAW